jgi:transposase
MTKKCPSGRKRKLSVAQEKRILGMVKTNNDITLKELVKQVKEDEQHFPNTQISTSTAARLLKKNDITLKTLDRVPAARNSPEVIEAR